MCAALMTPCHGEMPVYCWLYYSHKTKDYIALETGLFGEKTSACAQCICVCGECVRARVCVCHGIDIQTFNMKKVISIRKLRKFKSYDKRVITLWVLLHHERH